MLVIPVVFRNGFTRENHHSLFNSYNYVVPNYQSCYFDKDSTEVTSGFLAVVSVPHLNGPSERGKTGRQLLCKWRDKERERDAWMDGNLWPVFIQSQTTQKPHPLRNSCCKNISCHVFKGAVHFYHNIFNVFLLDKHPCCVMELKAAIYFMSKFVFLQ